MSIEKIVAKQYRDKVNQAVKRFGDFSMSPPEGWVKTVRTALGMSATQLAKRAGMTKSRISRLEKDEPAGSVTLKTMQAMSEAMGCRFVYAIIPETEVEEVIRKRALEKAREQVKAASTQMALESQALSKKQLEYEVERIASQIVEKMPSDLWSDK